MRMRSSRMLRTVAVSTDVAIVVAAAGGSGSGSGTMDRMAEGNPVESTGTGGVPRLGLWRSVQYHDPVPRYCHPVVSR